MKNALCLFVRLLFMAGALFCLAGCGNPVEDVKNRVLDLDKGMTLGEALDGYKYFLSTKWESSKTEQGKSIVECSGDLKDSSMRLRIQFQVNRDHTLQLAYAGLWRGNTEISSGGRQYLANIYANKAIDNTLFKIELIRNKSPEYEMERNRPENRRMQ